jgi:glucokinase
MQNMPLLGIDIGGTKIAFAIFSEEGSIISEETILLGKRDGDDAGMLITGGIRKLIDSASRIGIRITSAGISVPGIYHVSTGRVWTPNIGGWEDYPLLEKVREETGEIPVVIDSDRSCSILGEVWQGNARGCTNAVYLAVGTGIGAGILVNGTILRGSHDIAGAIGWMALSMPYDERYAGYGCFEYNASGDGVARVASDLLAENPGYSGYLSSIDQRELKAEHLFEAYDKGDSLAADTFSKCIAYWGMAVANLISLFNPEKIIIGGGLFGPALRFLPAIKAEAERWAQPVSSRLVMIEPSALPCKAALFGAAFLAKRNISNKIKE